MQRARKQEDKQLRRDAIMQAALELLTLRRFAEVKMAEIAQKAGLAKGTVFIYFPTKEALFLELLESLLEEWVDEINRLLDSGKGRWTGARVARMFTETLVSRESLTRLLTLLASVLEHKVEVERVAAFKLRLLGMLRATGARLECRLEFLRPGDGVHLIMQLYAVVVGTRQLVDPGDSGREALTRPELASLVFDFATELHIMLNALLAGLEALAQP